MVPVLDRVRDNLLEEMKFVSWTKMFSKGKQKISLVVNWCKLHGKNEKENAVFQNQIFCGKVSLVDHCEIRVAGVREKYVVHIQEFETGGGLRG